MDNKDERIRVLVNKIGLKPSGNLNAIPKVQDRFVAKGKNYSRTKLSVKMCSTNTAVALNKYVIAKERELRKLLKMRGGNGKFGLLPGDIKNFLYCERFSDLLHRYHTAFIISPSV